MFAMWYPFDEIYSQVILRMCVSFCKKIMKNAPWMYMDHPKGNSYGSHFIVMLHWWSLPIAFMVASLLLWPQCSKGIFVYKVNFWNGKFAHVAT